MVLKWFTHTSNKKMQEVETQRVTGEVEGKEGAQSAEKSPIEGKVAVVSQTVSGQDSLDKNRKQGVEDHGEKSALQTEGQKSDGWLQRLTNGLGKSSGALTKNISSVFTKRKLDETTIGKLQDILIMSDMGVQTAKIFSDNIAKNRFEKTVTEVEIKDALVRQIESVLHPVCKPLQRKAQYIPQIILMVGVNGAGKTTTIGKLAKKFAGQGSTILLVAADTFRAAAVEQLKIWGQRTGCSVISKKQGSDSGALVFEAVHKAIAEKIDMVFIDTAGRLHNKAHLMEELQKIHRVIAKILPQAPHDILLVLDGTVGQNAVEQVQNFNRYLPLSGLVMTKLDGTAKGGMLVNIARQFPIPIHAIGVGEAAEDLHAFTAKDFARSLLGMHV